MFAGFFLELRQAKVPVSLREYLTLMEAMKRNLAAHSVDLVDPTGGGIHTVTVTNPARIAALSKLKVGDTMTAVVSHAVAVEVTPASKSGF